MKKQTAVDFFYWELIQRIDFTPMGGWDVINNILDQAKAMEKEQIVEAYREGRTDQQTRVPKFYNRSSAIYYTSTYGQ